MRIQINAAQRLMASALGKTPAAVLKFFTEKYKAKKAGTGSAGGASHKRVAVYVTGKDVTSMAGADFKADGWTKTKDNSGSGFHWKKGDMTATVTYDDQRKMTFISVSSPNPKAARPSGSLYD
jgi:hypothetical protein